VFPPRPISSFHLHALPVSCSLTLARSTSYEAPHYAISPTSCYFILLGCRHPPHDPVLKRPQSLFFPSYQRRNFTSTKDCMQNYSLCISIFVLLGSRWEGHKVLNRMLASIVVYTKICKIFCMHCSSPPATLPANIILCERYFAKNINYEALHCVILPVLLLFPLS
jgi:hypothetical protein